MTFAVRKKAVGKTTKVVERHTRVKYEIRLGAQAIVDLLRQAGVEVPADGWDINVSFHVPGGGDWANEDVELDADEKDGDQVVTVSWVEEKVEKKG